MPRNGHRTGKRGNRFVGNFTDLACVVPAFPEHVVMVFVNLRSASADDPPTNICTLPFSTIQVEDVESQ